MSDKIDRDCTTCACAPDRCKEHYSECLWVPSVQTVDAMESLLAATRQHLVQAKRRLDLCEKQHMGTPIVAKFATLESERTALAASAATMREALEAVLASFLPISYDPNREGFCVDMEAINKAKTQARQALSLSLTPTHAEQVWQALEAVAKAAKAHDDSKLECKGMDCAVGHCYFADKGCTWKTVKQALARLNEAQP